MHALLLFLLIVTDSSEVPVMDTLVEVDPIIVIGQRTPQRLSKTVNSVVTVSPAKMQKVSADNIIEYLATSNASITSTAVNGIGYGLGTRGQGKLLIRGLGFSPNRGTLVMIDGRPDMAGASLARYLSPCRSVFGGIDKGCGIDPVWLQRCGRSPEFDLVLSPGQE